MDPKGAGTDKGADAWDAYRQALADFHIAHEAWGRATVAPEDLCK